MMETAKIRKAGYPIRHTFQEFVERFRFLVRDLSQTKKSDYRILAKKICEGVLPKNADFQFGKHKVFLKDADDTYLECERSRIFLKSITIIQRSFRKLLFRSRMIKYKNAVITIQRFWRGHKCRQQFLEMRIGIHRLEACIRSRQVTHKFQKVRKSIILLQARCRGMLTRKKLKSSTTDQQQLKCVGNSLIRDDSSQTIPAPVEINTPIIDAAKVVDDMFGFLDDDDGIDLENVSKRNVNNFRAFFEKESRVKKNIPSKLLAVPVFAQETRL